MTGYYARNHLQDDWEAEAMAVRRERLAWAEQEAGRWFDDATKAQKSEYNDTMKSLLGMTGPKWDRARQAAKDAWFASTAEARELYERTVKELLAASEVSEELSFEWDALFERETTKAAA